MTGSLVAPGHQDPRSMDPWQVLPHDRPFTSAQARELGVTPHWLRRWTEETSVRTVLRGVHRLSTLPDDLSMRVAAVGLVVPADGVVVDTTAAWLHGADHALAPGSHQVPPPVSVFRSPGYRVRHAVVASGERTLLPGDLCRVGDVLVTTPLRTALDLGRLMPRDHAFSALNALAGIGVARGDVVAGCARFRGRRGVRQLRVLAAMIEPAVQSPGESAALLRCHDAGLDTVRAQLEVAAPDGGSYFLDLADPVLRLAVEYDGEEHHDEDQRPHDEERRAWIRDELGWVVVVLRKEDVYGVHQRAEAMIRAAATEAQRRRPVAKK